MIRVPMSREFAAPRSSSGTTAATSVLPALSANVSAVPSRNITA